MTALVVPPPIGNGVRIVVLGDSISSTVIQFQFPKYLQTQLLSRGVVADIRQFGYPFQDISGVSPHVTDALAAVASNPGGSNILVVEAGTNDLIHSIDPTVSAANYDAMLAAIRADPRGTSVPVFCMSVLARGELWTAGPPIAMTDGEPGIAAMDTMIATKAALYGCYYVDTRAALLAGVQIYNAPAPGAANGVFTLAGDGVHPSDRGAALLAQTIITSFLSATTLSQGGYSDTHIKWLVTTRATMATLAQAAGVTIGNVDFTTDFMDGKWTQTQTGAGQATMSATLPAGVVLVNTNGSNGNVWVHPINKPVQVANLLTGTCAAYWKGRFTASDTAAKLLVGLTAVGLGDTPAGIGFGVVGPTSSATVSGGSTTKLCTTTNAGSGDVATATSINIDTAADHEVMLFLSASTASWYYDGALVSTVPLTSGLVGASTAAMVTARSRNPADATSRTLNLDRMICRR